MEINEKRNLEINSKLSKNTPHKIKDNAFKIVLEDAKLFAQFLNDFVDIPLLKDIDPNEIEDLTERFIPLISENKDGDTIKRITLKERKPLFVIGIVEHQTKVNYRMSFRLLEYIIYVLLDYEKEHKTEINNKNFKYPPVLPIVFYDGKDKWTAERNFINKVHLNDIFKKYIPKFEYLLINLNDYSQAELVGNEDALSLIMIIDKLTENEGLSSLKNLPEDYLKNLEQKTPKDLIEIVRNIIDLLMIRINVPDDERKELTDKVLERRFSDMFAWADNMDIQEERRKTEEQRKKTEEQRKKTEEQRKKTEEQRKKTEEQRQKFEEAEKVVASERQKTEAAEKRIKELETAEIRVKELEAELLALREK